MDTKWIKTLKMLINVKESSTALALAVDVIKLFPRLHSETPSFSILNSY